MSLAERIFERLLGAGPYDVEVRIGAENTFTVRGWVTADGSRGELTGQPSVDTAAGMDQRHLPTSGDLTVALPHHRMVKAGVTPSHPLYYAWLLDGAAPEVATDLEQLQPPFDWSGVVSFDQARRGHPLQQPWALQRWRSSWRHWARAVPVQVSSDGSTVLITVSDPADENPQPGKSSALFTARALSKSAPSSTSH